MLSLRQKHAKIPIFADYIKIFSLLLEDFVFSQWKKMLLT